MKISGKWLGVALFGIVMTSKVSAQVKISGEIRPRGEYRHGFKSLVKEDVNPAFFIEQRSRLIFDYGSEKMIYKLSLQDVRVWGAVDQIYKKDPTLSNVSQAWAGYKFTPKFTAIAGRKELDYDNARILGNLDWAQQGRSHDLLLLTYTDSLWSLHAGAAYNQDSNIPEPSKLTGNYYEGVVNYKAMQFAWFHTDLNNLGISLLVLNTGLQAGVKDTSEKVNYMQTLGTYTTYKAGKLKTTIEAYYSAGKDGASNEVSAYMLGASLTYAAKVPLTLGVDHLSGDDNSKDKETNAFNPSLGTNHKFYGFMDYFYVGNGHKNAGLTDAFLSAKIPTTKKTSLLVNLHQFLSAVNVADPANPTSNLSKSLGTEIDLVYSANLSDNVKILAGYSQMFGTSTMEALKGGSKSEINNWAFLMVTFTPIFFQK